MSQRIYIRSRNLVKRLNGARRSRTDALTSLVLVEQAADCSGWSVYWRWSFAVRCSPDAQNK